MARVETANGVAQERTSRTDSNMFVAVMLISAHTMQHVYSRGFLVILPFMMESLGFGTLAAGIMDSIRRMSSGIASMGGGVLTDRFQHLRGHVLAGSIGLMGFGYLVIGLAPSYYVILVALGFAAAAGSIWHPPALGILSQRFPERRGFFISLHRSAGNIGETIAPLAFGLLLAVVAWQALLLGVFPIAFFVAASIWIFLKKVGGEKKITVAGEERSLKEQLALVGKLFKIRGFVALLFVGGVRGVADNAVLLFLPIYLRQELNMGPVGIGIHVSLITVIAIVSGPLFGSLSDKMGRGPVIFLIMASSTVLVSLMVVFNEGMTLAILVALAGVFMFAVNSLTQAGSMDIAEGQNLEGSMIGLLWGVNALFGAASPVILGVLTLAFGIEVFFIYAAIFYAVGTLSALALPGVTSKWTLKPNAR